MGPRGFSRPRAFSSAETGGYSVYDSGGMVPSLLREEYRRHSSHLIARIIIKGEGGPASFRRGYPSAENEIWALILASRSLPNKGNRAVGQGEELVLYLMAPSQHCQGLQNGLLVWAPVPPVM